ncbi:MAG: FG-GAP-like repeat-containing protein, partial [Bacteroidetes bacterium]|nr:FG-GAP-like repeat-containing protein [Bacteroidota bacterium]
MKPPVIAAFFFWMIPLPLSAQFVIDSIRQVTKVHDRYPNWSPDGSRIAFMSNRNDNNYEIYVIDPDGSNLVRLTFDPGLDETPVWSPDGNKIAFASDRKGNLEVYLMGLDGSGKINLTNHPANDDHPKFSTDGSMIIFNSDRDRMEDPTNYEIYEMKADGTSVTRKTNYFEWDTYPSFSPDGRQILWRKILEDDSTPNGLNSEIFVMDRDGSRERNLTNYPAFDGYPAWSPDGTHIVFVSNRQGGEKIYTMKGDGSKLSQVTYPAPGEDDVRPIFHPGGNKLVFNRISSGGTVIMIAELNPISSPIIFTPLYNMEIAQDDGSSRGVAWGDYNNDGFPDLVVANDMNQTEFLYQNDGRSSFNQITEGDIVEAGAWSESVQWIDYDGDHDLDLFMTTQWGNPNVLFENQAGNGLRKVQAGDLTAQPTSSTASCWCDFDNDGDLDVYIVERDGANDALFQNDGKGKFFKIEGFPYGGGDGRACIWGDTNGDGFQDLFVINFLDKTGEEEKKAKNFYYLNKGSGVFSRVVEGEFVNELAASYGVSLADYDEDGDLDIFVTNVSRSDLNSLYQNDGKGHYTKIIRSELVQNSGRPSKGQTWGDYDNDGDLDLFVANGTEGTSPDMVKNFLYLNSGDGNFSKVEFGAIVETPNISAGTAWADYDRDGDLDIYIGNWGNNDENNAFYRNDTYGNNWIVLELTGTESNSMGIGTRVRVKAMIEGLSKWQTRWMINNTGYGSQNEPVIHFGLGKAPVVEELEIYWPSGQKDTYTQIKTNQYYRTLE